MSDIRDLYRTRLLGSIGLRESSTGSAVAKAFGFLLVGAAAGAVASLLLTPKSGRELREDVGRRLRRAGEGREQAGQDFDDLALGT